MMTAKQQQTTYGVSRPPPSPPQPLTVTAVKGNLITKSSPLATDSCKLEKQFIVAQNMVSHYKRVIGAKPSIDNKPPTSMVQSQKARDRARREMAYMRSSQTSLRKSMDTARSTQSLTEVTEGVGGSLKSKSATSNTIRRTPSAKDPAKPRVMPDQAELNRQMSEMMLQFTKNSPSNRTRTYRPPTNAHLTTTQNYHSSTTNLKANTIMNSLYSPKESKQDPNRSGVSGSSGKSPALAATSRLVSGKSYDVLDYRADKFTAPNEFQPRINKRRNSKSKLAADPDMYQPPATPKSNQSTAREFNDNSFVSITPRDNESEFVKSTTNSPPPHKTSPTHRISTNSRTKLNSSNAIMNESLNRSRNNNTSLHRVDTEKEENLKYLAFVKEVTDDVIARGISSNATINNCFEYHIDRNRGVLDESKMRDVLETLRKDLDMPSSSSSSNLRNKENMIGSESITTSDYLTLRKFGVHSVKTQKRRPSLSNSLNNGAWKVINNNDESIDESGRRRQSSVNNNQANNDPNTSATTKMYESYETHIVKNIQSIRRKSLEDAAAVTVAANTADQVLPQSGANSLNGSKLIRESSRRSSAVVAVGDNEAVAAASSPIIASSPQTRRRGSSSNSIPSQTGAAAGVQNSSSSPKPILKKNKSQSVESNQSKKPSHSEEDDDDLIFTPKKTTNKKVDDEVTAARRKKSSESLNNQLNEEDTAKRRPSKEEESMEDVFDNEYGDSENDADYDYDETDRVNGGGQGQGAPPQQAKFLKTKTFTSSELTQITNNNAVGSSRRRSSGGGGGSQLGRSMDEPSSSTAAALTPSITPRKSLHRQSSQNRDEEQED